MRLRGCRIGPPHFYNCIQVYIYGRLDFSSRRVARVLDRVQRVSGGRLLSRAVVALAGVFFSASLFAQSYASAAAACQTYASTHSGGCITYGNCQPWGCDSGGCYLAIYMTANTCGSINPNPISFFEYQRNCAAGNTQSGTGAYGIASTQPLSAGQHTCTPDGCDATFTPLVGSEPVCHTDAIAGQKCSQSGTATETGSGCGSGPPIPPSVSPQTGPGPCDSTGLCWNGTKICTPDGSLCIIPPGPTSDAHDGTAMTAGNPPPTPPGPPQGPGVNCSPQTSTGWSTNGELVNIVLYDPCPPPPVANNCPAGTVQDSNGGCISACPPGQVSSSAGCVNQCPVQGQVLKNGVCDYVCPPGQALSGSTCVTTCGAGQIGVNGICQTQCSPSQALQADGSCKSTCAAGTYATAAGCTATCATGTTADKNGICQPNTCGNGQVASNGSCMNSCPSGQSADASGKCQPGNTASGGTDCSSPPACTGDQTLCNIDFQTWAGHCSNKVSGGSDCSVAPSCTGDQAACSIVFQTWSTRCASSNNKASGGGSCTSPPTCTGDQVLCNIDTQAWTARCQNQVTGGADCSVAPTCVGDQAACAAVTQAWNLRCQLTADVNTVPTDAQLQAQGGTQAQAQAAANTTDNVDESTFDTSGFLGGGSCDALPAFSAFGTSFQIDMQWCDILSACGVLVQLIAYLAAIRIISR